MTDPDWTLRAHGVERCASVVGRDDRTALLHALGARVTDAPHAVRGLLWDDATFGARLRAIGLDALAARLLARDAFPIHALYLDKTADTNWKVTAHQDVVMPFATPVDEPGFTRWTSKRGVPHAVPPRAVLASLVALRLHLDDCGEDRGPLEVVPGSHDRGILSDDAVASVPLDAFRPCIARAGDVFAMRPLTLHRSAPATRPARRRVLHVVYATTEPGAAARWRRA